MYLRGVTVPFFSVYFLFQVFCLTFSGVLGFYNIFNGDREEIYRAGKALACDNM